MLRRWLMNIRWAIIKLIAGNNTIIINCTFQCDGLKEGWSISNPNNPERSLVLYGRKLQESEECR